ncbi:nucleotidyltransferase family protein [Streptomyces sp. VNUA24]|uniref:nucleotidyltransferase family protein n=1 Tax=Streptomyces sp. VNUA24 TaxID=3031131 RepID=UPI0023B7C6B3|nr:nucleotidyltransferase family protein [Streptomyces sp. VNUA24]WEH12239.1 nucleotidyltransferase family protein [Streptomyces sp. VNUA24]
MGITGLPENVRREAHLVHAMARLDWNDELDSAVRSILAGPEPIDWAYLVDQCLRQHVMPLVGRNVSRHRLWHSGDGNYLIPYPWIFSAAYEANLRRNRSLFREFATIFRELNKAGVRYAVRKGPVLCESIYRDVGIRRMNDLDLLVERDTGAEKVLADLGYAQGIVAENGCSVTPYARSTKAFWALHVNNKLPYKKVTTDPDVVYFEVDLCVDLYQKNSSGAADMDAILDRAVTMDIGGEPAYVLAPEDHLLDLCLHLYKEAVSLLTIEWGKDLTLQKFLDVATSLKRSSRETLSNFCDAAQNGGARDVHFVLHHTRTLYPDAVPDFLIEALAPDSMDHLDEYGSLDGKTARWASGFLERLFDSNRERLVAEKSTVPHR